MLNAEAEGWEVVEWAAVEGAMVDRVGLFSTIGGGSRGNANIKLGVEVFHYGDDFHQLIIQPVNCIGSGI
ncbi:hypothetical protein SERLADRAFT_473116, partial [Serpula lacrymans var. lacrymans S7.9]